MRAGDTFRLQGIADRHTWVVVSDPEIDDEHVLIASFTSFDVSKDASCIVEPHEFRILDCKSCIYYQGVRVARGADLRSLESAGRLMKRSPVEPGILDRIRRGVSLSRDIEQRHVDFLRAQGVIE